MIDDNTIIWRYFDSSKFKDLLETSEIFLCRADKLQESDPYEGSFDYKKSYSFRSYKTDSNATTTCRTCKTSFFRNL